MTNDDLIKLGFKPIPHFTVGNNHLYKLGRHRQLSVTCVGTPNEMLFITETSDQDQREIIESICIHNYDYDGYLTETKILNLIKGIVG